MFSKTFRSVVSLVMVFVLMIGIGGNAVVQAVNVPGGATVTNGFNTVIDRLQTAIDNLKAEIAGHQDTLDKGKQELLGADEKLTEANSKLAELAQKIADAEKEIAEKEQLLEDVKKGTFQLEGYAILAVYGDRLFAMSNQNKSSKFTAVEVEVVDGKIVILDSNFTGDATDLLWDISEEEGYVTIGNDEGYVNYKSGTNLTYKDVASQFTKVDMEIDDMTLSRLIVGANQDRFLSLQYNLLEDTARFGSYKENQTPGKYEYAYDLIIFDVGDYDYQPDATELANAENDLKLAKEILEKVKGFEAELTTEIGNAEAAVKQANEIIEPAQAALGAATDACNAAQELINKLSDTYDHLQDAANNPVASAAYVKDLVATMQSDLSGLWKQVKVLQDSLDLAIEKYGELGDGIHYAGINKHYEIHEEFSNGSRFDLDEVVYAAPVDYTFPQLPTITVAGYDVSISTLSYYAEVAISRTVTLYNTARYYWLLVKDKFGLDITISVETLQNLNRDTVKRVYNWLYNNPEKVCALVKEYGLIALDLLVKYGPYALDLLENHHELIIKAVKYAGGAAVLGYMWLDKNYDLQSMGASALGYAGKAIDFIMQYRDEVASIVSRLYARYGDEAKALVNVYVEHLNLKDRLYDATHDSYVLHGGNHYIALGDNGSAAWAKLLLGEIGLDEYEQFTDLTGLGTIEEVVQSNIDAFKTADLVTVGYSNTAAKYALNQLQSYAVDGTYEDIDWVALVGEHYAEAMHNALNRFENALIKYSQQFNAVPDYDGDIWVEIEGFGSLEAVRAMKIVAESFLYDYISYILESRRAVNAIHEVSPDALVVLVGMYNPFENVTVNYHGRVLPVAKAYDALIEAVDCYYLAYAFCNENTIFVNAPHVESALVTTEINNRYDVKALVEELAVWGETALEPTDKGSEYIKDQILDAVDVKILGDVDGNGIVNILDAILVLRYCVKLIGANDLDLEVADVNFNGKQDVCDAIFILRYCVKLIAEFSPNL